MWYLFVVGLSDWWKRQTQKQPSGRAPSATPRHVLIFVPEGTPDPTRYGFAPVGNGEERAAPLSWIPKESSPFGVPVLDCRSITRGFVSTAESQEQLETFRSFRADGSGAHVRDKHPEGARGLPCHLRFDRIGELPQGRIFTASRLEYKWDVTYHGSDLIFSRSWTGVVEYRASLAIEASLAMVTSIETAVAPSENSENDRLDILTVDFLVRTYLLREVAPFPLPDELATPEATHETNRLAGMLALKPLGCDARFGCPASVLWAHRNPEVQA